MLAPIALFVYNRPWHTLQTLVALKNNALAKESILYIFADGGRANASEVGKSIFWKEVWREGRGEFGVRDICINLNYLIKYK